jgi:hypothetical protein
MKHWQIKHTGWLNPKFLNQTWSRQVEHTGYFHPKVLNQTWRTDNLNIQGDSIQKFWTRHEELTSWTYRVNPSKSFQPDMKYWQIKHTGWFNSKVMNQTWSTDKLNIQGDYIQRFWTRHEVLTSWTYRVITSKSFKPDIKYWQVEHTLRFNIKVLNQTWSTDKLNIQEDSIQKFWTGQVEHTGWFHPSFEPDMKNRQVEYTGWFYPN